MLPTRRTDRGIPSAAGVDVFTEAQRIWLLEKDLDDSESTLETFRKEVKAELKAIRDLVTKRLNWVVGLGFSLMIAIISVLVTVVASK